MYFKRTLLLITKSVVCIIMAGRPLKGETFPELRVGSSFPVATLWMKAPIVLVGRIHSPRLLGVQRIGSESEVFGRTARDIYWCRAEMRIELIAKGSVKSTSVRNNYKWASTAPTCDVTTTVSDENREVWFIREEGGVLRPLYDFGTRVSHTIKPDLSTGGRVLSRESLGRAYIDPKSLPRGIEDLRQQVFSNGEIACRLMGQSKCVRELMMLALHEPEISAEICEFVKVTYGVTCR